jgi:hypothetical protein
MIYIPYRSLLELSRDLNTPEPGAPHAKPCRQRLAPLWTIVRIIRRQEQDRRLADWHAWPTP